jgi:CBS domain-containing protein
MTASPEYVSGDLMLDQLVHSHFLGSRHSRYPVMSDGAIVGLVTLPDIKRIDRADWPFVTTLDVTNRELGELLVDQSADVATLITRLAGDKPGALLVVGDGRLVGIVTRADVLALLQTPPD